jgi:hypothetical protein
MRANQLRLYLASAAYIMINELRRAGLAGTAMEQAQSGTIRLKLLKVGALIKVSVRRIGVCLSSAWPGQELFRMIIANLRREYPLRA